MLLVFFKGIIINEKNYQGANTISLIYQGLKKRSKSKKQNYYFIMEQKRRKNLLGSKHKIRISIRDHGHILAYFLIPSISTVLLN